MVHCAEHNVPHFPIERLLVNREQCSFFTGMCHCKAIV